MENEEIQTTFNTDPIEVLVEDGEIENINNEGEPEGIGADSKFTIRTTKPGAGNKFYIKKASGGMSICITGKPTDPNCDVLSNCVGYANGRFNEVYCEVTGKYEMPYQIKTNAETWIEKAQALGLQIVDHPVVGSVLCMKKGPTLDGSDGAGHVIFVEKVIDNNTIYTSESAYGGSAFYNVTRRNTNGRWGMGADYSFRGFIVNPALPEEPQPEPTPTPTDEIKEGDWVVPIILINYKGTSLKQYDAKYKVTELVGDRAVCSALRNGKYVVWAAMNVKNLKKI